MRAWCKRRGLSPPLPIVTVGQARLQLHHRWNGGGTKYMAEFSRRTQYDASIVVRRRSQKPTADKYFLGQPTPRSTQPASVPAVTARHGVFPRQDHTPNRRNIVLWYNSSLKRGRAPSTSPLSIPLCSPVDETLMHTWLVDELVVQEDECGEKPGRGD